MNKNEEIKNRILKGIAYFRDINPSKWNEAHTLHAKTLHRLMESYLNGEEVVIKDLDEKPRNLVTFVEATAEKAKEIFE